MLIYLLFEQELLFFSFFIISFLLFFCLSRFAAFSYHCSIFWGWHSDSISLCWITLFISCLNSSINSLLSYALFFAAFLNSYMNSSIILFSCFTFFNLATFIVLLSFPPNSFLKSAKNSSIVTYSNVSAFKSSKIFFF